MNKLVLGIDEVGRGSWAGPLVVGAVALYQDCLIEGLNDSKKLTPKRREQLARQIQQRAAAIGIGWVDARVIDTIGLSAALHLASERAFAQIPADIREAIQCDEDGLPKIREPLKCASGLLHNARCFEPRLLFDRPEGIRGR